jgi:hypothetical protein
MREGFLISEFLIFFVVWERYEKRQPHKAGKRAELGEVEASVAFFLLSHSV